MLLSLKLFQLDNLKRLLQAYQDDKRTKDIIAQFDGDAPARIKISGISGAQLCFIVLGSYLSETRNHLVVMNDKEEAAYFENTISSLFEKKSALLFPDSF